MQYPEKPEILRTPLCKKPLTAGKIIEYNLSD